MAPAIATDADACGCAVPAYRVSECGPHRWRSSSMGREESAAQAKEAAKAKEAAAAAKKTARR